MTVILGARALIDNAIPTGVDGNEIFRFEMQEGMTPVEVITMASTVIGQANEHLANTYGGLIVFTERLWARYRQGDDERRMTSEASEYAEEDGEVSDRVGHMLYTKDFKDATAWSRDYLERAIREDLRDDVLIKQDKWVNRIDHDVISAMFRSTEIAVGQGWSVPWAIGTGMQVNFIPPQWMVEIFDSTHTHFIRVNAAASATNVLSTIETLAQHLAHHGHQGMKVLYVGDAIADIILDINDKKKVAQFVAPEFRLLSGNSGAPVATVAGQLEGLPGEIIAYIQTKNGMVEVRKHTRVPAGYLWMGKSYGRDNAKNPMAVRLWKGKGFGLMVNPQVDRSINPTLDKILFKGTHGVNVNDRTAGVAAQIASGGTDYEQPTIS